LKIPLLFQTKLKMGSINGMTPTKPFNIAIVGGGLGGVALAIGLIKQGVPTHIYEAAAGFGEIGAGVIFGPNSARALNLIDPAMLHGFKKCATFNESADRIHTWLSWRYGMDSRDGNGKKCGDLIWHLEDEESVKLGYGTRTRCGVHRARFLDELVKLIPDSIVSFQKSLVGIEILNHILFCGWYNPLLMVPRLVIPDDTNHVNKLPVLHWIRDDEAPIANIQLAVECYIIS
jgi:hypothetical protein